MSLLKVPNPILDGLCLLYNFVHFKSLIDDLLMFKGNLLIKILLWFSGMFFNIKHHKVHKILNFLESFDILHWGKHQNWIKQTENCIRYQLEVLFFWILNEILMPHIKFYFYIFLFFHLLLIFYHYFVIRNGFLLDCCLQYLNFHIIFSLFIRHVQSFPVQIFQIHRWCMNLC